MKQAPDPGRWLKALAEHSEASERRSPTEQLAQLHRRLDRHRRRRHTLYWAGALVTAGIAAFILGRPQFEVASATHTTTRSTAEWMDARSHAPQHTVPAHRPSGERRARAEHPSEARPSMPAEDLPTPASERQAQPESTLPEKTIDQIRPTPVEPVAKSTRPRKRRPRPQRKQAVWRSFLAQGQASEALAAMDQKTLDAALAQLSAQELHQLAQAARAQRDLVRARAILGQIRTRFAGQASAGRATFLLGRVEHDLANDPTGAARWFEGYISDYADGTFAGQARGRLLAHYIKQGDDARARQTAADYLRFHTNGPYADISRRLLNTKSK